jgi:hypothetical protein
MGVWVQSDSSWGKVVKLMYIYKDPFIVEALLINGSYMLQRWNKPESSLLKYYSLDIYIS